MAASIPDGDDAYAVDDYEDDDDDDDNYNDDGMIRW